jgi:hypothetical protein
MVKLLASYNEKVSPFILSNTPQNAKYISHQIKKKNSHVFARNA